MVLPLVLSFFGLGGWTETLLRILRWPVLICLVVFGLAVLYRFGPSRVAPMGVALGRKRHRRHRLACGVSVVVMVSGKLC